MEIKKVEHKVAGYFFMSINNDAIKVDMAGDDVSLAAAFGMLFTSKAKNNTDIKRILGVSLEFAIQQLKSKKEYSSKKSNTVPKTPTKAVKRK